MRLKEIKPGMVIHCKNEKEKKMLLEEAERLGYVWYSTKGKPTERSTHSIGCTIHFYDKGTSIFYVDYKHITHSCQTGDSVIEFSDLIIPELTAEELLDTIKEICENNCCNDMCALSDENGCIIRKAVFDKKHVIEACIQWKSDHEKKEPEIETEWFWQGRIFKVEKDGSYYQIKDGNGFYDTGCEYQESAEEYMSEILKEYCKTHDGDFIAVVNHVCRVKAVE